MKEYQGLSHTRWDCKYHIVFIPKRRKKRVFGVLRRHLGEVFHERASHKESTIVESFAGRFLQSAESRCLQCEHPEKKLSTEHQRRLRSCTITSVVLCA